MIRSIIIFLIQSYSGFAGWKGKGVRTECLRPVWLETIKGMTEQNKVWRISATSQAMQVKLFLVGKKYLSDLLQPPIWICQNILRNFKMF